MVIANIANIVASVAAVVWLAACWQTFRALRAAVGERRELAALRAQAAQLEAKLAEYERQAAAYGHAHTDATEREDGISWP